MKKFLFLLFLFPFTLLALDSSGNYTYDDLTPVNVGFYDHSGNRSYYVSVKNWDEVYYAIYNSTSYFTLNSNGTSFNSPANYVSLSTNSFLSSTSGGLVDSVRVSSPSGVFGYVSPAMYPPIRSLYTSAVSLIRSGFTGSSISRVQGSASKCFFKPYLMISEVLSSSSSEYRSILLSNLSSINNSLSDVTSYLDSVSASVDSLRESYLDVNAFESGDFSSLSNSVRSLEDLGYISSGLADSLLDDLDTRNFISSEIPNFDLFYKNQCRVVANTVASVVKLRGIGNVLGLGVPQTHDQILNKLGGELNRRLSNDVTSKLDDIKDFLPEIVSGSNRSFRAVLEGAFSNNWNLVTNDHNVVNQALVNITNYIQGADLGQIHSSLSNIVVNTLPLPKVYREEDNSLRVYVVNPSSSDPGQSDPSSQMLDAFGDWVGDGGTNTWNLFAGNLIADFEDLIEVVRAFRYDFRDWTHNWDDFRDKSIDHFNLHRSYVSYITNFVSEVLEPTMSMLRGPLIDYTNVLSVASSRLAKDYDLENGSTLAYTSSMLANIPETDSLLHDVQELTNVVDFSSRSLIEQSLATTNQFNDAVSLYYKDVSLPSKIDLDIYQDISFSIPVSQQASLWTLLRNGLGFGLFIVNVLLFPKFLLHLLRLLFGAADSFYANQAKP